MDKFELHLLSTKRHFEHLEEYQAPSVADKGWFEDRKRAYFLKKKLICELNMQQFLWSFLYMFLLDFLKIG